MKKLLTILSVLMCIYSEANTYYFSNAGSDSYTSVQAQNPSTPWATINKLNSYFSSLLPGDFVLFRRGDTFYGSISSTVSGGSGNPITFGAYGSGAAPKISSAVVISSWTGLGGGIYESTSAITPTPESAIKMVTIGGIEYAMGRTPNANAANSGYLSFESHTSSSITDNTNPFTSAYNGSTLVARATQGNLDQNTVTTISGNVINFSGGFDNGLINNFGYFLENTLQSLDQYGEWYYNTTTHKLDVYFGSSGTSPVTVSTKNMLMNLAHNYFSVDGINFQYANMYGIFASNNPSFGLNINNCSFTFCGINGVGVYNRNTITIDSCSFNWCNAAGVNTGSGDTLATVTNCTFSNIGTFQGMLFPDIGNQRYGMGIFSENGLTCINNRFNNIGYVPIYFTKSNNLIQYNYIDTFCTILADGGGIYTYNYKPGGVLSTYTNRVVRDNIVLHGIGAKNGAYDPDPTYNPAEGIYIDDNSMNVNVINNTVAYCADAGIYLHNSPDGIIRGNVLYENGGGLLTQHGDPNLDVSGITFKKNQIFTTGTGTNRLILNLRSQNNDFLNTGTFDSNYYCKPYDTANLIQTNWFSHATTTYHLSNWKTATSKDAHTVQTPVPVSSSSDILFLYNETGANKNNNLGGNTYKSVTGNTYAGSITLTPFTSQILLRTASDTTSYTYHIQHDTLERTTVPEKINIIGYRDSTIFDTSYTAYSIYKTYWNVDGSIVVTIPLYDTIAAHDTVFICTGCASHDTTVAITTTDPETAIYGMFPNNGETSFAQRLHVTKQAACNAFRYNWDLYSSNTWSIKQIRDSGLKVLMTINSDQVQPPIDPFPTGSELTRRLVSFDSILTTNSAYLPDVLFIQNEESNKSYWSGTATQYMAWLNGCVTIAHNHGIPISNGGILPDIAYYIRAVWKAEGKTDSVNLITKLGNLPTGVGAAQQVVIDWYSVEVPGLAANGGVDYINLHWYEPTSFISDNSDTTSGMLPLAINFLRSRTGKPVVTHEWGTKSSSQAFFNTTANQWKDNGVNMMIYYSGTGPVADPHPEFWRAWILQ